METMTITAFNRFFSNKFTQISFIWGRKNFCHEKWQPISCVFFWDSSTNVGHFIQLRFTSYKSLSHMLSFWGMSEIQSPLKLRRERGKYTNWHWCEKTELTNSVKYKNRYLIFDPCCEITDSRFYIFCVWNKQIVSKTTRSVKSMCHFSEITGSTNLGKGCLTALCKN